MAKFRTPKNNRTTYVYRDAHGNAVILRPGENGVTETDIALLHGMDDEVHNAEKRDSYHGLLHLDATADDDETPAVLEKDLADCSANPEDLLIHSLESAQKRSDFNIVWTSLTEGQRALIKKKLQGHSNVDIAAEDGVTETAIRNRLSKIQKKFEQFLR